MNKILIKAISTLTLICFTLNQSFFLANSGVSIRSIQNLSPASVAQSSIIPVQADQILEQWQFLPQIPSGLENQFLRYYQLKHELIQAADQDQPDLFRKKVAELLALVGPLRRAVLKVDNDRLFELIQATFSQHKFPDYVMGLIKVSENQIIDPRDSVRRELEVMGQEHFDPKTEALVNTVIDEVVIELYEDSSKQEYMREKIRGDVRTSHLKNQLEPELLEEEFILWKQYALAMLSQLHTNARSFGYMIPILGKVNINPSDDALVLRCTLKHELVHYLAHHGEIKIPEEWENITYAVDILERVKQVGESALDTYKDDFGIDILKELFLRGKEMGLAGDTGFIVRPGISDHRASYFSSDILILEARKIYAEKGLNADRLLDPYDAQKHAGILLGGILTGMVEKDHDLKPLALLRDFFYTLHQRWAPPSKEEIARIEKNDGLIKELQNYASSLSGTNVRMIPSTSGLWQYEQQTQTKANLHYLVTDLYPRSMDGETLEKQRAAARERGLGQVLLAINKIKYGKSNVLQKLGDLASNREFLGLWETLLTPNIVYNAFSRNQEKINSLAVAEKFKGAPSWIARLFADRYQIGNPLVEEALLRSLPLHLQFLDTLLYRWSRFDGKSITLEDPRLKNRLVAETVMATFSSRASRGLGWDKLMFYPQRADDEDFLIKVITKVWPEYEKLYEEALKQEELRRAHARMMQEDHERLMQEQFDRLTEQEKKDIENYLNALPQEVQQAIQQAAQQQMQQAMDKYSQMMQSGAPQQIGQGTPQPSSQPSQGGDSASSQPTPASSIEGVEEQLKSLEQSLSGLEQELKEIGNSLDQVKEGTGEVKEGSEQVSQGGSGQKAGAESMSESSSKIQGEAQGLLDEARDFNQAAQQGASDSRGAMQQLPSPEQGESVSDQFDQMGDASSELLGKAKKIMDLANKLKGLADKLNQSLSKESPDASTVGAQNSAIKETVQNMENEVRSIKGSNRDLERLVEGLEKQVSELKESLDQAQQGDSRPQTASDLSGSTDQSQVSQPQAQPVAAPQLNQPADLSGLNQLAEKYGADLPEPQSVEEELEAPSLFDEAWLEALRQQEELDIKRITGLSPEEKREYDQWYEPMADLIENMTEVLARGLGLPTTGIEWLNHQEHGGIFKHLVQGLMGAPAKGVRIEREPKDVKITFLLDTSGSMSGDRLKYAKLTLFTLLEVVFELNEQLVTKGFHPIEFEIGVFSDKDKLILSHESSEMLDGTKKERIIYDLMKKIVVDGGTDDVRALGRSVTRLEDSPNRTSEGSRKLMFVMTDGNLGAFVRDEIKQIVRHAEEQQIAVIPIAVGDEASRTQVLKAYGSDRAIVPKNLKELAQQVLVKFADFLEPPAQGRSWLEFLPSALTEMTGLLGLLGQFIVRSAELFFSTTSRKPERKLIQVEGYRHFFIEEKAGRSYLVYKKEGLPELSWERGTGGSELPSTKVPDVDYNEKILLKILRNMYRQGQTFSSYSADGNYLIRYASGDQLEVLAGTNGSKKIIHRFPPQGEKPNQQVEVESNETIYSNQEGIQWKGDSLNGEFYSLNLALNGDGFTNVFGWLGPSPAELTFVERSKESLLVFHAQSKRVFFLKKGETYWEVEETLQMEGNQPSNEWEGSLIELSGEPGIGKGELLRAAAHLLNEEIFFIPVNEDMEVEDLTEYRGIGIEQAGVSTYTPSIVAKVRHFGGLLVFDEINKGKAKVLDDLKAGIASRTHRWREADESGMKKQVMIPDHPRARIFGTSNLRRKGVASSGSPSDQAMQRRKRLIRMNWMPPNQEIELQLNYAMSAARESGKLADLDGAQIKEYEKKLSDLVRSLVKIAIQERLSFIGYSAVQMGELLQEKRIRVEGNTVVEYPNWNRLSDPEFKPANGLGLLLKRPPSPRTIKSILRHFVFFPEDRKNRAWSTIKKYFTYAAEEDPKETYRRVETDFEAAGFIDSPSSDFYLRPESFKVVGDLLVVTPVDQNGVVLPAYDPVEVFLHPDAEIREGIFPLNTLKWIRTSGNAQKIYEALQSLALGKNLIFVGEQETGKSTLAVALARLISGPNVLIKPINYQTSKEQLSYEQHIGEEGKAFQSGFAPQEVPQAMNTKGVGKILILEETPQGRPGTLGVLNEVMERGYLVHSQMPPLYAKPGFAVIHAINPPGKEFNVAAFSDEFLERHTILEFEPLGPKDASGYIQEASKKEATQLNPKIVGEVALDEQGKPGDFHGQMMWTGLMGLEQFIRYKRKEDPSYLPRSPGLGTFKKFVRKLVDYYAFEVAYSAKKPQEIFWEFFLETFTLEGEERKIAIWRKNLRKAFVGTELWIEEENKDAIELLLNGEEMVVQQLGVVREPKVGLADVDAILTYIQENTLGASINFKLNKVREFASAEYSEGWEEASFGDKLERVYKLKEIYQVLGVVIKERPTHAAENLKLMQSIQENIQSVLLIQHDWPESILDSAESEEQLAARFWKTLYTEDSTSDLLLQKAYAFPEELDYAYSQLQKVKAYLEKNYLQALPEREKHKQLKRLRHLYNVRVALFELVPKLKDSALETSNQLVQKINAFFQEQGIPLAEASGSENELIKPLIQIDNTIIPSLNWQQIDQTILPKPFQQLDKTIHPLFVELLNQLKNNVPQEINLKEIRPLISEKSMQLFYQTLLKLSLVWPATQEKPFNVVAFESLLEKVHQAIPTPKTNRYTQRLAQVQAEIERLEKESFTTEGSALPKEVNSVEVIAFLINRIESSNIEIKIAAIKALTELRHLIPNKTHVGKYIFNYIGNENKELVATVVEALIALGFDSEEFRERLVRLYNRQRGESFTQKRRDEVDPKDISLRLRTAWALALLKHEVSSLEGEMVQIWYKTDDAEGLQLLIDAFNSINPEMNMFPLLVKKIARTAPSEAKIFAIQKLLALELVANQLNDVQGYLKKKLKDNDIEVVKAAFDALSALGVPGSEIASELSFAQDYLDLLGLDLKRIEQTGKLNRYNEDSFLRAMDPPRLSWQVLLVALKQCMSLDDISLQDITSRARALIQEDRYPEVTVLATQLLLAKGADKLELTNFLELQITSKATVSHGILQAYLLVVSEEQRSKSSLANIIQLNKINWTPELISVLLKNGFTKEEVSRFIAKARLESAARISLWTDLYRLVKEEEFEEKFNETRFQNDLSKHYESYSGLDQLIALKGWSALSQDNHPEDLFSLLLERNDPRDLPIEFLYAVGFDAKEIYASLDDASLFFVGVDNHIAAFQKIALEALLEIESSSEETKNELMKMKGVSDWQEFKKGYIAWIKELGVEVSLSALWTRVVRPEFLYQINSDIYQGYIDIFYLQFDSSQSHSIARFKQIYDEHSDLKVKLASVKGMMGMGRMPDDILLSFIDHTDIDIRRLALKELEAWDHIPRAVTAHLLTQVKGETDYQIVTSILKILSASSDTVVDDPFQPLLAELVEKSREDVKLAAIFQAIKNGRSFHGLRQPYLKLLNLTQDPLAVYDVVQALISGKVSFSSYKNELVKKLNQDSIEMQQVVLDLLIKETESPVWISKGTIKDLLVKKYKQGNYTVRVQALKGLIQLASDPTSTLNNLWLTNRGASFIETLKSILSNNRDELAITALEALLTLKVPVKEYWPSVKPWLESTNEIERALAVKAWIAHYHETKPQQSKVVSVPSAEINTGLLSLVQLKQEESHILRLLELQKEIGELEQQKPILPKEPEETDVTVPPVSKGSVSMMANGFIGSHKEIVASLKSVRELRVPSLVNIVKSDAVRLLKSAEPEVVGETIETILALKIKNEKVLERLKEVYDDSNTDIDVRVRAAVALVRFGALTDIGGLSDILRQSQSISSLKWLIEGLTQLGMADGSLAVLVMAKLLNEGSSYQVEAFLIQKIIELNSYGKIEAAFKTKLKSLLILNDVGIVQASIDGLLALGQTGEEVWQILEEKGVGSKLGGYLGLGVNRLETLGILNDYSKVVLIAAIDSRSQKESIVTGLTQCLKLDSITLDDIKLKTTKFIEKGIELDAELLVLATQLLLAKGMNKAEVSLLLTAQLSAGKHKNSYGLIEALLLTVEDDQISKSFIEKKIKEKKINFIPELVATLLKIGFTKDEVETQIFAEGISTRDKIALLAELYKPSTIEPVHNLLTTGSGPVIHRPRVEAEAVKEELAVLVRLFDVREELRQLEEQKGSAVSAESQTVDFRAMEKFDLIEFFMESKGAAAFVAFKALAKRNGTKEFRKTILQLLAKYGNGKRAWNQSVPIEWLFAVGISPEAIISMLKTNSVLNQEELELFLTPSKDRFAEMAKLDDFMKQKLVEIIEGEEWSDFVEQYVEWLREIGLKNFALKNHLRFTFQNIDPRIAEVGIHALVQLDDGGGWLKQELIKAVQSDTEPELKRLAALSGLIKLGVSFEKPNDLMGLKTDLEKRKLNSLEVLLEQQPEVNEIDQIKRLLESSDMNVRALAFEALIRYSEQTLSKNVLVQSEPSIVFDGETLTRELLREKIKVKIKPTNDEQELALLIGLANLYSDEEKHEVAYFLQQLHHNSDRQDLWTEVPIPWLYSVGLSAESIKSLFNTAPDVQDLGGGKFAQAALEQFRSMDSYSDEVKQKLMQSLGIIDWFDFHRFYLDWLNQIGLSKSSFEGLLITDERTPLKIQDAETIERLKKSSLTKKKEFIRSLAQNFYLAPEFRQYLVELLPSLKLGSEVRASIFMALQNYFGSISKEVEEEAIKTLHSSKAVNRLEALKLLLRFSIPASHYKDPLKKLLSDRKSLIRAYALGALVLYYEEAQTTTFVNVTRPSLTREQLETMFLDQLKKIKPVGNYKEARLETCHQLFQLLLPADAERAMTLSQSYYSGVTGYQWLVPVELLFAIGVELPVLRKLDQTDYSQFESNDDFLGSRALEGLREMVFLSKDDKEKLMSLSKKENWSDYMKGYMSWLKELGWPEENIERAIKDIVDKGGYMAEKEKIAFIEFNLALGIFDNSFQSKLINYLIENQENELGLVALKGLIQLGASYPQWWPHIQFDQGNQALEMLVVETVLEMDSLPDDLFDDLLSVLSADSSDPLVIKALTEALIAQRGVHNLHLIKSNLEERDENDLGRMLGLQMLGEVPDANKLEEALKQAKTEEEALVFAEALHKVSDMDLARIYMNWESGGSFDQMVWASKIKTMLSLPKGLHLIGFRVLLTSEDPSQQVTGIKGFVALGEMELEDKERLLELALSGNQKVRYQAIPALTQFEIDPGKVQSVLLKNLQELIELEKEFKKSSGVKSINAWQLVLVKVLEALIQLKVPLSEYQEELDWLLTQEETKALALKAWASHYNQIDQQKSLEEQSGAFWIKFKEELLERYLNISNDSTEAVYLALIQALVVFQIPLEEVKYSLKLNVLIEDSLPLAEQALKTLLELGFKADNKEDMLFVRYLIDDEVDPARLAKSLNIPEDAIKNKHGQLKAIELLPKMGATLDQVKEILIPYVTDIKNQNRIQITLKVLIELGLDVSEIEPQLKEMIEDLSGDSDFIRNVSMLALKVLVEGGIKDGVVQEAIESFFFYPTDLFWGKVERGEVLELWVLKEGKESVRLALTDHLNSQNSDGDYLSGSYYGLSQLSDQLIPIDKTMEFLKGPRLGVDLEYFIFFIVGHYAEAPNEVKDQILKRLIELLDQSGSRKMTDEIFKSLIALNYSSDELYQKLNDLYLNSNDFSAYRALWLLPFSDDIKLNLPVDRLKNIDERRLEKILQTRAYLENKSHLQNQNGVMGDLIKISTDGSTEDGGYFMPAVKQIMALAKSSANTQQLSAAKEFLYSVVFSATHKESGKTALSGLLELGVSWNELQSKLEHALTHSEEEFFLPATISSLTSLYELRPKQVVSVEIAEVPSIDPKNIARLKEKEQNLVRLFDVITQIRNFNSKQLSIVSPEVQGGVFWMKFKEELLNHHVDSNEEEVLLAAVQALPAFQVSLEEIKNLLKLMVLVNESSSLAEQALETLVSLGFKADNEEDLLFVRFLIGAEVDLGRLEKSLSVPEGEGLLENKYGQLKAIELLPKMGVTLDQGKETLIPYVTGTMHQERMKITLKSLTELGLDISEIKPQLKQMIEDVTCDGDYHDYVFLLALTVLIEGGIKDDEVQQAIECLFFFPDSGFGHNQAERVKALELWVLKEGEESIRLALTDHLNSQNSNGDYIGGVYYGLSQLSDQLIPIDKTMEFLKGPCGDVELQYFITPIAGHYAEASNDIKDQILERLIELLDQSDRRDMTDEVFKSLIALNHSSDELFQKLNDVYLNSNDFSAYKALWLLPFSDDIKLNLPVDRLHKLGKRDVEKIIETRAYLENKSHLQNQKGVMNDLIKISTDGPTEDGGYFMPAVKQIITLAKSSANAQQLSAAKEFLYSAVFSATHKESGKTALSGLLELGVSWNELQSKLEHALTHSEEIDFFLPATILSLTSLYELRPEPISENTIFKSKELSIVSPEIAVDSDLAELRKIILFKLNRGYLDDDFFDIISLLRSVGIDWLTLEEKAALKENLITAAINYKDERLVFAAQALKEFELDSEEVVDSLSRSIYKFVNSPFEFVNYIRAALVFDMGKLDMLSFSLDGIYNRDLLIKEVVQQMLKKHERSSIIERFLNEFSVTAFNDTSDEVLIFAIKVLVTLNANGENVSTRLKEIAELNKSSRHRVIAAALHAWVDLGLESDELDKEVLLSYLKVRSNDLRQATTRALGYYSHTDRLEAALRKELEDSRGGVRLRAIKALLQMGISFDQIESDIFKLLRHDTRWDVIQQALDLLIENNKTEITSQKLWRKLKAKTSHVRILGAQGLLYLWAKESDIKTDFLKSGRPDWDLNPVTVLTLKEMWLEDVYSDWVKVKNSRGGYKIYIASHPLSEGMGTEEIYLEFLKAIDFGDESGQAKLKEALLDKMVPANLLDQGYVDNLNYLLALDVSFEQIKTKLVEAFGDNWIKYLGDRLPKALEVLLPLIESPKTQMLLAIKEPVNSDLEAVRQAMLARLGQPSIEEEHFMALIQLFQKMGIDWLSLDQREALETTLIDGIKKSMGEKLVPAVQAYKDFDFDLDKIKDLLKRKLVNYGKNLNHYLDAVQAILISGMRIDPKDLEFAFIASADDDLLIKNIVKQLLKNHSKESLRDFFFQHIASEEVADAPRHIEASIKALAALNANDEQVRDRLKFFAEKSGQASDCARDAWVDLGFDMSLLNADLILALAENRGTATYGDLIRFLSHFPRPSEKILEFINKAFNTSDSLHYAVHLEAIKALLRLGVRSLDDQHPWPISLIRSAPWKIVREVLDLFVQEGLIGLAKAHLWERLKEQEKTGSITGTTGVKGLLYLWAKKVGIKTDFLEEKRVDAFIEDYVAFVGTRDEGRSSPDFERYMELNPLLEGIEIEEAFVWFLQALDEQIPLYDVDLKEVFMSRIDLRFMFDEARVAHLSCLVALGISYEEIKAKLIVVFGVDWIQQFEENLPAALEVLLPLIEPKLSAEKTAPSDLAALLAEKQRLLKKLGFITRTSTRQTIESNPTATPLLNQLRPDQPFATAI